VTKLISKQPICADHKDRPCAPRTAEGGCPYTSECAHRLTIGGNFGTGSAISSSILGQLPHRDEIFKERLLALRLVE
jgi:hypothetical protein